MNCLVVPRPGVHQRGGPDLHAPVRRPRPSRTRRPPRGHRAPLGPVVRRGAAHPRPVPPPIGRLPLSRHALLHHDRDTAEARARPGDHLHQPARRPHSRFRTRPF